jgi:predicted transcriptional regulator
MLKKLMSEMREGKRGPTPKIDLEDLATVLIMIKHSGGMGRYRISEEMEIPNGTIRGVLKKLSETGILKATPRGCELTDLGEKMLMEYLIEMGIERIELYEGDEFNLIAPGKAKVLAILRSGAEKVTNGLMQRDEAVRAGADGATIIVKRMGIVLIPGVEVSRELNEQLRKLEEEYGVGEGGVAIFCWGKNLAKAVKGALKAATTLQ